MGNRETREDDRTPNWHPISALPMIAFGIDGMLHDTQEQYKTLLKARDKPHVLDDDTVDRVHSVFTTQLEYVALYDEQLSRWESGRLNSNQRQEVERLIRQIEQLRQVCQQILSLAAELKEGTIDRIMEKSDLQLGVEILTGKTKPPWDE
jgi:hypothetical protein